MSWDSYRDTMTGSGNVKMAAVCGIEGGVWTTSPGFNVSRRRKVGGPAPLSSR